jgi:TPR repeat protein
MRTQRIVLAIATLGLVWVLGQHTAPSSTFPEQDYEIVPAESPAAGMGELSGPVPREARTNPPLPGFELAAMIVRGDPSGQIVAQVGERGVTFQPDPESLGWLKAIGAATEVLDAVRAARVFPDFHFGEAWRRNVCGEAEQALRSALKRKADSAVLHSMLGSALECQRRGDDAIAEYREAIRLQGNFALAHYSLANALRVRKDIAGAIPEFRRAAELGNAAAQSDLGWCYYIGLGVPQDAAEAVKWFRKAAEQGDASAQNRLGVSYDEGKGVRRDQEQAVGWYRMAADRGCVLAQYNLAQKYNFGAGVPQDYAEAAKWYRKAAEQGYATAQIDLGVACMKGEGVPQNEEEGLEWFEEASRQGDPLGSYFAGLYYWKKGSASPAVERFELAARQGSPFGAFTLAEIYSIGPKSGGEPDNQGACVWYRIAEQLDKRGGARWWNPADVKKMREELPKRIEQLRGRLSPSQFSDCERQASEWIEEHVKESPQ